MSTYLPARLQGSVSGGELVAFPAVWRGYPAHPHIAAQLVQPLQLLYEVSVQLSRSQCHAAHGTTRRVRLELLLAWGREDIRETEGHGVGDECRVITNQTRVQLADSPLARLPALPYPA